MCQIKAYLLQRIVRRKYREKHWKRNTSVHKAPIKIQIQNALINRISHAQSHRWLSFYRLFYRQMIKHSQRQFNFDNGLTILRQLSYTQISRSANSTFRCLISSKSYKPNLL